MEKSIAAVSKNISLLKEQWQDELAGIFSELVRVAVNEPSETFDRVALLRQVEVLTEQATLPKNQRKELQISASLFYVSLFSAARGIGTFLIEHRTRLDQLLEQ